MIAAAVVYMIIEFPGGAHEVRVLPMANMEICRSQSADLIKQYKADGHSFQIAAYCIESGLSQSDISN